MFLVKLYFHRAYATHTHRNHASPPTIFPINVCPWYLEVGQWQQLHVHSVHCQCPHFDHISSSYFLQSSYWQSWCLGKSLKAVLKILPDGSLALKTQAVDHSSDQDEKNNTNLRQGPAALWTSSPKTIQKSDTHHLLKIVLTHEGTNTTLWSPTGYN